MGRYLIRSVVTSVLDNPSEHLHVVMIGLIVDNNELFRESHKVLRAIKAGDTFYLVDKEGKEVDLQIKECIECGRIPILQSCFISNEDFSSRGVDLQTFDRLDI